MSKSLGEEYPIELERLRELIKEYESIGPAGMFGKAVVTAALRKGEQAQASGDVVAMMIAYQEMRDCQ